MAYNEKRGLISKVATEVMHHYDILSLSRRDKNLLLIYDKNNGIYQIKNPQKLDKIIYDLSFNEGDGDTLLRNEVIDVRHMIQSYLESIGKGQINANEFYLPVNNGLLELKTGELHDFTSEVYFTKKLPVDYDSNRDVPEKFYNSLLKVFEGYEWQIEVLQEFMGYCLYFGYPYKKFLFLHGSPGNGINLVLEPLKALVGKDNRQFYTFSDLLQNRNDIKLEYFDKLINICGKMGEYEGSPKSGQLNKLLGNNTIRVDEKYENGFDFTNRTKLIFSGNLPKIANMSGDLLESLIILDFPNRLTSESKSEIKSVINRCNDPEFLTGILTWSVKGLQRLLNNNGFSYNSELDEKINYLQSLGESPLKVFVKNRISYGEDVHFPKEKIYDMYCAFVNEMGLAPYGKKEFYKQFPKKCFEVFGHNVNTLQKKCSDGKRRQSFNHVVPKTKKDM